MWYSSLKKHRNSGEFLPETKQSMKSQENVVKHKETKNNCLNGMWYLIYYMIVNAGQSLPSDLKRQKDSVDLFQRECWRCDKACCRLLHCLRNSKTTGVKCQREWNDDVWWAVIRKISLDYGRLVWSRA